MQDFVNIVEIRTNFVWPKRVVRENEYQSCHFYWRSYFALFLHVLFDRAFLGKTVSLCLLPWDFEMNIRNILEYNNSYNVKVILMIGIELWVAYKFLLVCFVAVMYDKRMRNALLRGFYILTVSLNFELLDYHSLYIFLDFC